MAVVALPAQAAEIVVIGSPTDNASPAAMAIVTSVRGIVLDHPWLGLAEIDSALVSGSDTREPLRKATRDLRAARAKFDDLLIDEAAKLAQSALTGYREHLAQASDLRSLGRALELMGAIALTRSDIKAASEAIEEILALNPEAAPNPEIYNPPMIKRWQQIAARYKGGGRGTLVVEAPPGEAAVVEVDGRYRGLAPLTMKDVLLGQHYVRVSRAGSLPWGQRVAVGKKAVRVAPQLTPLKEAAAFAAARAKAWDPSAETRKQGLRELG
ncbi:MAG TPA: PEGA domain-containing protein, partial [Myxococcota bacterium]|nr:PEGA domain-containing protein [Myxococcota bacterium]